MNILERRRYSKEIDRFADRFVSAYVQSMTKTPTKTPTMTAGDVRSGVRAIAQAHQMDERIVAADILDVVNKWVEKNVRLGPSGMKVPRSRLRESCWLKVKRTSSRRFIQRVVR